VWGVFREIQSRKEVCVRDFLNGLHPKFKNRRATLYESGKLPNLEQAISAIISESLEA
jgi:hypothetical protein